MWDGGGGGGGAQNWKTTCFYWVSCVYNYNVSLFLSFPFQKDNLITALIYYVTISKIRHSVCNNATIMTLFDVVVSKCVTDYCPLVIARVHLDIPDQFMSNSDDDTKIIHCLSLSANGI